MRVPAAPAATFDSERFAYDVRQFLGRQDVTIRALACRSGVNVSTVSHALYGIHKMSLPVAVALAAVCDLSLDSYVREAAS